MQKLLTGAVTLTASFLIGMVVGAAVLSWSVTLYGYEWKLEKEGD